MANEPSSSIYEQKIEHMGSMKDRSFAPRIARFLNPVAKIPTGAAPMFKPVTSSKLLFKGWNHPQKKWAEWVDLMAGKYSSIWIKSGIFDSIMSSIYEVTGNHDLISVLLQFWSPKTNTFVFPWGEATITLEDVMILGGYSVIGDSVDGLALMADLGKKVEEMNGFRLELVRSKSKKALHSKWIELFMEKENEHEHIAFLSLWLSRFVFPSLDRDSIGKHVLPFAVKLSHGIKLALAPAILASIYNNLTRLREQCVDSSNCCINLLGPFQLVQIWAYERFPIVGPKPPNDLSAGEPRLARWHNLNSNLSLLLLNSHLINPENFIWRPYAVDLKHWFQPLYYQDSEQIVSDALSLDDDLQSFVRILQPCELNGLSCKAKYLPHHVAMQFGFDQDIPADLSSYKLSKFVKFFVPSRSFQPGVSMRYSDWWKNLDRKDRSNHQDSLGEAMNASVGARRYEQEDFGDRNCDLQSVHLRKKDLEEMGADGFDDMMMCLKNICNATKRKIDSLKGSYVGDSQSKKRRLAGESGNGIDHVVIEIED